MACDELHPKGGGVIFIGRKAGKTCDRHLCARHGVRQQEMTRVEAGIALDDTIDFCPAHAELARASGGTTEHA